MGQLVVSQVCKAYKRYPGKWSRALEWVSGREQHQKTWVLRDISFRVDPGESVGIVGVNGAGKSTLLKIITGTTRPTSGSVEVRGRVAALLELGMGFHPDFTGRQNAFMAGQLLGLKVDEIGACMPAIEAFAAIGDYIDRPVRTYSSGMQMRVAFAVATAVKPDILIVDEALSVGDASFQRKCFRRIEEFREQGTTLLFVSHDIECVKRICNKALFIKDGLVSGFGQAKTVCDMYEKALFGGARPKLGNAGVAAVGPAVDEGLISDCEVSYGDGRADIESIWLERSGGSRANVFGSQDTMILKYRVRFNEVVSGVAFAFMIKTRDGVALFGTDSSHMPDINSRTFHPGETVVASFELANAFAPGTYYVNFGVRDDSVEVPVFLHRRVDSVLFRINADENTFVKAGLINAAATFELGVA